MIFFENAGEVLFFFPNVFFFKFEKKRERALTVKVQEDLLDVPAALEDRGEQLSHCCRGEKERWVAKKQKQKHATHAHALTKLLFLFLFLFFQNCGVWGCGGV
jgi:hypothetical protein